MCHSDLHFLGGGLFCGYLVFDTIYSLVFYKEVGSLAFLLHHVLGFVGCGFGLYKQKMAIFGIWTQASACLCIPYLDSA